MWHPIRSSAALLALTVLTPAAFGQFHSPYLPKPQVPAQGTWRGPYLPAPQVPAAISPSVVLPANQVINPYLYGFNTPYLYGGAYTGFGFGFPVYPDYTYNAVPRGTGSLEPELRMSLASSIPSLAPAVYPRREMDARVASSAPLADEGTNVAVIAVSVPENAEVFLEGERMKEKGSVRRFASPELTPGKSYVYTVRAKWSAGGKDFDETMSVPVKAGDRKSVAFLAGVDGPMSVTTASNNVRK